MDDSISLPPPQQPLSGTLNQHKNKFPMNPANNSTNINEAHENDHRMNITADQQDNSNQHMTCLLHERMQQRRQQQQQPQLVGEEEQQQQQHQRNHQQEQGQGGRRYNNKGYMILLAINYLMLFAGSVASSLLAKFYFVHKGTSRWVSTWIQCAGFPILLIPIYIPYLIKFTGRKPFTDLNLKIGSLSVIVGLFLGLNNLLISWGTSYLPVSTSSLLLSMQLAFTLILSAIIVKQKITFMNLNCVVLLTLSSVLMGLSSSHDRPHGLTRSKYFIGFFSTIGAGLLFALYLPVMEKIFRQVNCYQMVIEMQFIMELAATFLATVGMAADRGFQGMKRESQYVFDLGSTVYWLTIGFNILTWQCCFMGTAGMVFLTTSLTGGVCMTALMAINVLAGVLIFKDKFSGPKAVATVLCAWGFCSYVYGMYVKASKKVNKDKVGGNNHEMQMTQIVTHD